MTAIGNATQGVELPQGPVQPTGVDSETQADDYILSWRALLPVNGPKCQATGLHVDARTRWPTVNVSVQSGKIPKMCSVRTILDMGSGIKAISEGTVQNLQEALPDVAITRAM